VYETGLIAVAGELLGDSAEKGAKSKENTLALRPSMTEVSVEREKLTICVRYPTPKEYTKSPAKTRNQTRRNRCTRWRDRRAIYMIPARRPGTVDPVEGA